ncbi:hypothetical protein AKO1_004714 [Acrasis kona]|uniref:Uncharacterized protein n=1 Tax=Acrasis kona TaxID=1008807 RepID=A0AAW2Z2Q3_9EUKA
MDWCRDFRSKQDHTSQVSMQRNLSRILWKNASFKVSDRTCIEVGHRFGSDPVDAKFDSTGQYLAIATTEKPPNAGIYNLVNSTFIELSGHNETVSDVQFCGQEDSCVVTCSYDSKINVWDKQTGTLKTSLNQNNNNNNQTVPIHTGAINYLAPHFNSNILASCGSDNRILLWNIFDGTLLSQVDKGKEYAEIHFGREHSQDILYGMTITNQGTGLLKAWDIVNGKAINKFTTHSGFESMCISRDGRMLAGGGSDGSIKVFDCKSDLNITQRIVVPDMHHKSVVNIGFSSCGTYLQSCGADARVNVYDVRMSHKFILQISHEEFTFHQDAEDRPMWGSWTNQLGVNLLATGGEDGIVKIWDISSGEQINTIPVSPGNRVYTLHFSPFDDMLVAGTDKVLDTSSAKINIYTIHSEEDK